MKNKLVLIILLISGQNSCKQKTEIVRLNFESVHKSIDHNQLRKYYIIENPPKELNDVINLLTNSSLGELGSDNTDKRKLLLIFYKKSFWIDRNYKPDYKWYNNYVLDDISYDNTFHKDDLFAIAVLNDIENDSCDLCPVTPYYEVYGEYRTKYYPNGFRNNPNKHWEKMKD